MKNEVYLVVNGEKRELTQEQLKSLRVTLRKNPFERVDEGEMYYCIDLNGRVNMYYDSRCVFDEELYDVNNYFNDKSFAKQVNLHQLLYRKLLKFAYENGFEDTAEWDGENKRWSIYYNYETHKLTTFWSCFYKSDGVYFSSEECAEQAITEVVEPFMKEHPEFIW